VASERIAGELYSASAHMPPLLTRAAPRQADARSRRAATAQDSQRQADRSPENRVSEYLATNERHYDTPPASVRGGRTCTDRVGWHLTPGVCVLETGRIPTSATPSDD